MNEKSNFDPSGTDTVNVNQKESRDNAISRDELRNYATTNASEKHQEVE